MWLSIINFILEFLVITSILISGWYLIWMNILIDIPIVREVCGLDEKKNPIVMRNGTK